MKAANIKRGDTLRYIDSGAFVTVESVKEFHVLVRDAAGTIYNANPFYLEPENAKESNAQSSQRSDHHA